MEQTIGVTEARMRFSELIDQVRHQGNTIILTKNGKPAAALISIELFERWKAERREAIASMRRIQANVTETLSDEESMVMALEAQEAVRTHPSSTR